MEEDIDQMKTPGFQAEDMVIEHKNNVHQRPVVVRSVVPRKETPDTFGKYRRYVPYLRDPRIFHNLVLVVIYKKARKSVGKYGEGNKQ